MGWLSSWEYRKSHIINAQAGAGTNYQKQIVIHYGSGTDNDDDVYCNNHCRTDFGDIRFTDNDSTLLDYWMESKVDSNYAIFWVEVADNLSSQNQTIYIYYGNNDATSIENGDNTFIFFDHFLGDSLDLNKWIVREGNVTVSNSQLVLTGTTGTRGRIDGLTQFESNTAIHAYSKCSNVISSDIAQLIGARDGPAFLNTILLYHGSVWYFDLRKNGLGLSLTCGALQTPTQMHIYKITWLSTLVKLYQDNTLIQQTALSAYIPTVPLVYYYREPAIIGSDVYVDWIFVRKYVSPEPTHGAWGIEENTPLITPSIVRGRGKPVKPTLKIDYWSNYLDYGTIKAAIQQALEETRPIRASLKKSFEETIGVKAKIAEAFEETMPITASVLHKFTESVPIKGDIKRSFSETINTTSDIMKAIIIDGVQIIGTVTPLLEKLKELKRKLRKI